MKKIEKEKDFIKVKNIVFYVLYISYFRKLIILMEIKLKRLHYKYKKNWYYRIIRIHITIYRWLDGIRKKTKGSLKIERERFRKVKAYYSMWHVLSIN